MYSIPIIPLASAGAQSKHWHKGQAVLTSDFNGSEGVAEPSLIDLMNRRAWAESIASSAGMGNRGRSSSTKKCSFGNWVVMVVMPLYKTIARVDRPDN